MKQEEKVIMYDSPEAAQTKTVTGWVSSSGQFFGKDEHTARLIGSTHKTCNCGQVIKSNRGECSPCMEKRIAERYSKMPFKEWDGNTFLYSNAHDRYFRDSDDLECYVEGLEEDNEGYDKKVNYDDLSLIICEPCHYTPIDSSLWEDILPEDGEVHPKLQKKLDELNELIKTLPPASWMPGGYRTSYCVKENVEGQK